MSTRPALQVGESDLLLLAGGWRALAGTYGGGGASDGWLAALIRYHSAPERRYHNLRRVAEMLRPPGRF